MEQPDCFFQIWSSDPVPKDRCPVFKPPSEDFDIVEHPIVNFVEDTVHYTNSRRNRKRYYYATIKNFDPIRKGDQFEYLVKIFIDICDANRMEIELGNREKKFFDSIKTFDRNIKKWNSDHPGDLHDFFAVRLVRFLEVRAINYQRAVDEALAIAYTAETNFDGSIVAERAIHDSARAVKNASAIVDAALSDLRIAKTLIKK
jgi:hypothetical protein